MLVLSRKLNESITLPELGITITVVGVGTRRVKIGIDAPENVTIRRQEVLDQQNQMVRRSNDPEPQTARPLVPGTPVPA
ncbi:carbon storage regulator [Maioricimonas sp. JC845]|uniref:carbon storage regulator n=1 Tax=Maioricimonas sp. JC845 TaxID=3232138 RepID=UPI003459D2B3